VTKRTDVAAVAEAYGELFPAIYLRLHRRDRKRSELSGASSAVLMHLAQTGPITIGEAALHLGRAQSVVTEIVAQLERHGLVARIRGELDRRRTEVWLTDVGRARLVREQEVLERELVEAALARMSAADRAALVRGSRALAEAAGAPEAKSRTKRRAR
jgi:DNA-binding MarR family transcriptional regulator